MLHKYLRHLAILTDAGSNWVIDRELTRNTPINTNSTLPDMNSTPEQLRFASIPGHTIRSDLAGGGLSSNVWPLLLRGVDRQIGLTERIHAAVVDTRHASYITHSFSSRGVVLDRNTRRCRRVHSTAQTGPKGLTHAD